MANFQLAKAGAAINASLALADTALQPEDIGDSAGLNVGTTEGTVAAGDDSRLSDARTPTSHASSHESGGADELTITLAQVSDAGNAAALDVGTTSGTVAAGDDSRLSDDRTPTAHAASHVAGGADALTLTLAQISDAGSAAALDEGDVLVSSDLVAYAQPLGMFYDIAQHNVASYTLALGDQNSFHEMTYSDANEVVIPANADVAIPIKSVVGVCQYGTGTTTVRGATGVIINGVSAGSFTINNRYVAVQFYKRWTNEWILIGSFTAA